MTPILSCSNCGTDIAPSLLACPSCHQLVHAQKLRELAQQGEEALRNNDLRTAVSSWREALLLLPPATRQYQVLSDKVTRLSEDLAKQPATGTSTTSAKAGKVAGATGTIGLILWKLKTVLLLLLTKAKFLLLGLTKLGALSSLLLSLGVYWAAWGWKFAVGLIASMYLHEMGHVAKLHAYGIRSTSMMFIPGLGAMVRSKQYPAHPRQDARVGLAGPLWGLGTALGCYGLFLITGYQILAAIAQFGGFINLFNLIPVWQLDGARGLRSLNRLQRILVCALLIGLFAFTQVGFLVLILIFAVVACFVKSESNEPDWTGFAEYAFLAIVLSLLCLIHVQQ